MVSFNKRWDKIAVIAPSSTTPDAHDKLAAAIALLTQREFHCLFHKEIFSGTGLDFFAAEKRIRVASLKSAIQDPEVKVIWTFRGGYGATEIAFDCLEIKPLTPKILIGYSDITALHALFNQQYRMPSIHGSVLTSLLGDQADMLDEIIGMLNGDQVQYELERLNGVVAKKDEIIDGEIVGGNLAIYCNLIGTKLHPDTNGKILIFEDTNEKGYQAHRYLMHLYNAGIFTNVKAVIFGDFVNSDESLNSALDDFILRYLSNTPVFRMNGFGHGKVNHPVLFGSPVEINRNKLKIKSPFKIE